MLTSARAGIDRYLVACTCVGIEVATGEVYAPHGFAEMAAGLLRMNMLSGRADLFRAKAESYRVRWPWLQVIDPACSSAPVAACSASSETPGARSRTTSPAGVTSSTARSV